jgi:hypothetical protein
LHHGHTLGTHTIASVEYIVNEVNMDETTSADELRYSTSTWTRNIVTSAWTIQYEYMDEEHSDECMDDTLKHEYNVRGT